MKQVYFHKNIILARSKVSFSVKTECVFLLDNLDVRFFSFIDYKFFPAFFLPSNAAKKCAHGR